jgi:hypothetical protein
MQYTVKKSAFPVKLDAGWDSEIWQQAKAAKIANGFEQNSDHTPDVQLKLLHDGSTIHGLFRVDDRYVAARARKDQDQVCRDSCVEFFVKPAGADCYFNFEMNCGGILLLYRCVDLASHNYIELPLEDLATVKRYHSLPQIIDEEITEPTLWYLGFSIPTALFEKYAGTDPVLDGQQWVANFTKCADRTSHPTWLSWVKLSRLSFHLPDEFGKLIFE